MASTNNLPALKRFITTHDDSGKAIFSSAIPEENKFRSIGEEAGFALGYTTKGFPVDLNEDKDLKTYESFLSNPPGIVVSQGTVLRFVDVGPGHVSPMHRTVSLDYGVVLEGDIELILDSGETRRLGRGDVAIQRGTMHAWRNNSNTEWARMMYVLQGCEKVKVGEKVLEEDYGTMQNVPPSE
jgi:quercetin dioxygenase-like cupin family protein